MRHQDHHPQEENDRVPVDGLVSLVERKDVRQYHGHSTAEGCRRSIKVTSQVAFDGDQQVGHEEDRRREPVDGR